MRTQRRWSFLAWASGALFLGFLAVTLWNLRTLEREVQRLAKEEIRTRAFLVSTSLLGIPETLRTTFLETLVRSETAVYLAILDSTGQVQTWASAFEGFLPLEIPAPQTPEGYRKIETPFGPVLETRIPLNPRETLVLGYPYFLTEQWLRRIFSQSLSFLLILGGVLIAAVLLIERLRQETFRKSQRIQALEAEQRRYKELHEMAQEIAHEIKNPLNVLALALQRLEEEEDPEKRRSYIHTLLQEIRTLARRVEGFLEAKNPVAIQPREIQPKQFLKELQTWWSAAFREKGILLEVQADNGLLWADPELLKQALNNLIQNALEATQEGWVKVRAQAQNKGWVFEVEDTGEGIPESRLHKIFWPGFTTRRNGTGLGLVWVRKIVEAHGGAVEVESSPGKGTRFRFWIPRHPGGLSP